MSCVAEVIDVIMQEGTSSEVDEFTTESLLSVANSECMRTILRTAAEGELQGGTQLVSLCILFYKAGIKHAETCKLEEMISDLT